MDPLIKKIKAMREGSHVKRCHVTPHHGEYTVGKHSFDALCLLWALHPDPSMNLAKCLAFHDLGERWVGDMPATAKMLNSDLGIHYEYAEGRALDEYGIELPALTKEEAQWLTALDKVELWLWVQEQLYMGNRWVEDYVTVLKKWFSDREAAGELPTQVRWFLNEYTVEILRHTGGVK